MSMTVLGRITQSSDVFHTDTLLTTGVSQPHRTGFSYIIIDFLDYKYRGPVRSKSMNRKHGQTQRYGPDPYNSLLLPA